MFYQIQFAYAHGNYCVHGQGFNVQFHQDEELEDKLLQAAEAVVERTLKALGLNYKHAYSFPDGSLYKYVKSDLGHTELCQLVIDALAGSDVCVSTVFDELPESNPHKLVRRNGEWVEFKTLEEYFE